ncbi:hypothetical protein [Streptomyces katrae]|uniref:hypothetical protein n=1 Tax=Streptomyces katrae TaxID=68223 RepID=UPI00055F4EE9|nr:hypothetical protein [Streptomyces katrae]
MGHTVAGWAGPALGLLGCTGAGVAVCAAWFPGIWLGLGLGLGLVAAAGVVTWVLHLAGWGKPSGARPRAERDWRTRATVARTGRAQCLGCRVGGPGRAAPARHARGCGPPSCRPQWTAGGERKF